MLNLQEIFYWSGTSIGLILFIILSVKFIKQIKFSSTKFGKYRAAVYWLFIVIALVATASSSLIIICSGVVIDVALISYLYQKKNEINDNKKYELRFQDKNTDNN